MFSEFYYSAMIYNSISAFYSTSYLFSAEAAGFMPSLTIPIKLSKLVKPSDVTRRFFAVSIITN